LLLDEKNVCLINGKAISLGAAVRWFAEEWPKHTDANWGDDPFMARFFKLIADQLEPAGVLVAGIPDAELLGNIASHEGVTLTMPITLPPNVWMDMFVGSMKLKKPLVEVLSEGLVTEDLVNDCFVNTTGG
jgi:hypothetical protein